MKHTKGKWQVNEARGYEDKLLYYEIGLSEYKNFISVKINPFMNIDMEEAKANAKLIAAAPDLLQSLTELWEHTKIHNETAFYGKYRKNSLFGKVEQIIKKATV